jgi:zinc transporter ZupT
MHTWQYVLLFATIVLSGLLYFAVGRSNHTALKLALSFTGAFLFAISVIHLMPSVYETGGPSIGLYVLAGFFIQVILEFFSGGIEHGHTHKHHIGEKTFPAAMMIGLSVHSFLEGMPLSGHYETHGHQHTLLSGIILHHAPVAFALTGMLAAAGLKKGAVVFYLALFAAMAPLGALCGDWLGFLLEGAGPVFDRIMAVVIGIFLHISTTILFESDSTHRFNLYKLGVILAGAAFAVAVF